MTTNPPPLGLFFSRPLWQVTIVESSSSTLNLDLAAEIVALSGAFWKPNASVSAGQNSVFTALNFQCCIKHPPDEKQPPVKHKLLHQLVFDYSVSNSLRLADN